MNNNIPSVVIGISLAVQNGTADNIEQTGEGTNVDGENKAQKHDQNQNDM